MRVKKIGEAKIDLDAELWYVEGVDDRFQNDRRLIDTRPEIKTLKSTYMKVRRMDTPSRRKPIKRDAYFQARDEYRHELRETLNLVYQDLLEESQSFPIPLQKCKDYNHPREWRHALYQGMIYEFDRHGASSDEKVEAIQAYLSQQNPNPTPSV